MVEQKEYWGEDEETPSEENKVADSKEPVTPRQVIDEKAEDGIEWNKDKSDYTFFIKKKIAGKEYFVPYPMKRVEEFEEKEKEPMLFRWIFPISLVFNIVIVLLLFVLGNVFVPLMISLVFSTIFLCLFFVAGENFWIWISYFMDKSKNGIFKIKSYIAGSDTLHFEKMREAEKFNYVDDAKAKRVAEVRTRKTRYFNNLSARYAFYREGYTDSIDWHEEYPASRINRDLNTAMAAGPMAGYLLALDKILALMKKKDDFVIWLIIGGIALLLLAAIAYFMMQNNPAAIAEALKSAGVVAQPAAGTVTRISG